MKAILEKAARSLRRLYDSGTHRIDDKFRCSFKGCNCKPQGEIGAAHAEAIETIREIEAALSKFA